MSDRVRRPGPAISRALALMVFLAAMAAAIIWAVVSATPVANPRLEEPLFQTFLLLSSAALSALIGRWLASEAARTRQPAVRLMKVQFYTLALMMATGAMVGFFKYEVVVLEWYSVLSPAWAAVFSLIALLALIVPAFRQVLQRTEILEGAAWGCFAVFVAISLILAIKLPGPPPGIRLVCSCLVTIGVVFALGYYVRRPRQTLLSIAAAQMVFLLGLIAGILGPVWHLLWWYSHVLYFGCLVIIAYGILEGYRVVEREELIAQLGVLTTMLEEQTVRDPLTGSFNRRQAMISLELEFKKAGRGRLPLTLLVGDVDDFKKINDNYGHPCGDAVLREISQRLADSVRESDIVARCGGEEFWIVLPMTNRVGGQEVANKTLEAVRSKPIGWQNESISLTMSIGIADTLTPGVGDVASLIHEADRALYAAKRAGKDRAVIVDPLAFTVPAE